METVMKKLFFILFISLALFFSCDQHAKDDSLVINIPSETVKAIFNTNNRSADTFDDWGCFYAYLIGSNGTKYEKSSNPFYLTGNMTGPISTSLEMSGITFRESYDLYVYAVKNGTSIAGYREENIELNMFGPTRKSIELSPFQGAESDFQAPYIYSGLPDGNYNQNGSYIIKFQPQDSGEVSTPVNAPIAEFKVQKDTNSGVPFEYEFYILQGNKQINITNVQQYQNPDGIWYTFTYTFPEVSSYKVACRKTNLESHCFKTTYLGVEIKSNVKDTNYVIYDNTNGLKVWYSNTITDSTASSTYYDNATANTFDYCWDKENNFYITDGHSVYVNGNKTSAIANTSENEADFLTYNEQNNLLLAYSIASDKVGLFDFNPNNGFFNWSYDPNRNDANLTIENIASANDYIYLIYNKYVYAPNGTLQNADLVIYAYPITYKSGAGYGLALSSLEGAYKLASLDYIETWAYPSPYFHVNDTIVLNNNLYLLVTIDDQNNAGFLHYCGFVVKFNLSSFEVSVTGISDAEAKIQNDSSYYNSTYYNMTNAQRYYSSSTTKLINPQRFVAIKPKELVISDDGLIFWSGTAFDEDGHPHDAYYYKNLNRTVSLDVNNFSISNVNILNNVKWEAERTFSDYNWACGAFIYKPN